jgi:hypothetical protein
MSRTPQDRPLSGGPLTPARIRQLEDQVRRRHLTPQERKILLSARPVALMMDGLAHLSYEELLRERDRLENARRTGGIHPLDWFRLHAVRALIRRHELEFKGQGDEEPDT